MWKFIIAVAAAAVVLPAHSAQDQSKKITKGYYTMDAMGCMLLRECTEDVKPVNSLLDVSSEYDNPEDFTHISAEFNSMVSALNQVGSKVFLADEKYFPVGHRGVYHTVSNNMFLNKRFVGRPHVLMSVMRHEGWHAAQDCMAGTINNNMIAIIHNEEDVPKIWQEIATKTYKNMPNAIPWEKEAFWAGKTEGMTMKALQSCAAGTMFSDYQLTPMTREWLVENGYLTK
tara:strand:- start:986 stop:1672 length:687 start_codon:yes stop_codon:yes gene_type:complete